MPAPTIDDGLDDLRHEIGLTDDPEEKYNLLIDLVGRLRVHGEFQSAVEPTRQALALADTLGSMAHRANALRLLAALQGSLADFKGGMTNAKWALKLSQQLGDTEGEAAALAAIGMCHIGLCDYPRALKSLDASHTLLQQVDAPATLAQVLMNMSTVHTELGNPKLALNQLLDALVILEQRDETGLLPALLNNIGWTYRNANEMDDAGHYWKRSLDLARAAGNRFVEWRVLSNLGSLYRDTGRPEQALDLLRQALDLAHERNDKASAAMTLGQIGRMHWVRGEHAVALDYLAQSRTAAEARGDIINQLLETWVIGSIRIEIGELHQGIALLHDALALSAGIGARTRDWDIHRLLADAYERLGDTANALVHYKLYAEIKEEVMGKEQQRAIDTLRMKHDIETANREREIFRLENEKLQGDLLHKHNELTSMALHLVQKNETLEKLKEEVVQMVGIATADAKPLLKRLVPMIQQSIGSEAEWAQFEQQFVEVHPDFVDALLKRAGDLTQTEMRIASLLRIQLNTKDIATIMNVTTRAVEKHRLHIRRKLGLEGEVNLGAYLATL